ncbi:MAG: hypothetical protein O6768_03285 [Planctomycetota bacterium]|nr:hypothetical protein [Planctomycetota bacterium]
MKNARRWRRWPLVCLILFVGQAPAQDDPIDATLVGHWNGFAGSYGDVWGDGNYAYIGHFGHAGVHIVDISDPTNPQAVEYLLPPPNGSASAQDVKVADDLLFIGLGSNNEAAVHIVDVRNPLDPIALIDVSISGFNAIHNVFYNAGFLYFADSGTTRVGIVDLTGLDPDNPPPGPITTPKWILENVGSSFVHDMVVRDGRLYACAWDSGLWIYDVTNVATQMPTFLGSTPDGGNNTHSCWPTANGDYVVTGEEREGGGIKVYRITDQGTFVTLELTDSLALPGKQAFSVHNQVIDGYRLYNAWYQAGLQVFDIDPATGLLEFVASYDTFAGPPIGFNGAWGVYPFLGPPDRVVVSDLSTGLYIIDVGPQLLVFSYPQGRPDLINPDGDSFAVEIVGQDGGALDPDSPLLHYDAGAGFVDVPLAQISESLYDVVFPSIPCGQNVSYYLSAQTTSGISVKDPLDAPSTTFETLSGFDLKIVMEDDFEADTGWVVGAPADDATTGIWERVDPNGTPAQPGNDHTPDPATMCFVTGQGSPGGPIGANDVDSGKTTLTSPVIDLLGAPNAEISYWRWYSNDTGASPNADVFVVDISNNNGSTWTNVETVGPGGPDTTGGWIFHQFSVADFVAPTAQVRLRFIASDEGDGSIVEAAMDDLQVAVIECGQTIPGDLDGDGTVGILDLLALLAAWGPCPDPPAPCPADLDGDENVGILDLLALLANWG